MSLAGKTSQLRIAIRANNDVGANTNRIEYYVTIQNKAISIEPEFYGGGAFDETIGAKRISNLRGFRVSIDLSYNMSQEKVRKVEFTNGTQTSDTTSTFRDMFNEIMSAFRDGLFDQESRVFSALNLYVNQQGDSWVAIQEYSGSWPAGSFVKFIPTQMTYEQTYTSQIGRFRPSITLVAETLLTEIGPELEGRS
jgi:hypothetical protein